MGAKSGRVETRPYYSEKSLSARFYDLTTAADTSLAGDIDLYAALAPAGGSVLELGSGTGRVSFALAARGIEVLGVDLAPAMLAQAEAKLRATRPDLAARLRFQRGDMASLNLGERFDAVIAPYFALGHLPCGAAWRNVFTGVARHLKPSGRAAFHLPSAEMLGQPPGLASPVARGGLADSIGRLEANGGKRDGGADRAAKAAGLAEANSARGPNAAGPVQGGPAPASQMPGGPNGPGGPPRMGGFDPQGAGPMQPFPPAGAGVARTAP